MNREMYRRVGAVSGLFLALVLIRVMGYQGYVAGAAFGIGGTLCGGILGEQVFDLKQRSR